MADENDQLNDCINADKKVCNFVSNVYGSDTAKKSKGKELSADLCLVLLNNLFFSGRINELSQQFY